jgi:ribose/xylose/arabinose/galactoside ABC-type transport system permease subunit
MHTQAGENRTGATTDAAASRSGLWRRLLLAPESGLVLVIALLMTLLTVFSGTKQLRETFRADAGTTISEAAGVFTVTSAKEVHTLRASDGWELAGTGAAQRVTRSRNVNKFLNLENLMQVMVFASFIAIMAVGITAVITLGGIDLSVGSIYALAALFGAIALRYDWVQGFPAATLRGSHGLWWAAIGLGLLACVGSVVLRRRPGLPTTASPTAGGGVVRSLPAVLLWVGLGLVLAAGWQWIATMHEVGVGQASRSQVGAGAAIGIGLVVCVSVGAIAGWLNGTMIVGLKVHPFIITLGTMAAYRGIVALPTQAQSVGTFPESFQGVIKKSFDGITPVPVAIMLVVCVGGMFVLTRTVLGRRVFAIGGNEVAATYAGIDVGRVKKVVYTMMGALAGLSAFVYLGYYGGAEPAAGTGYELKAIAAAVIGGASLSGGRGSALGAVLGAILVQFIDNAMVMLQIDQSYNQIVLGAAIIVAVVLDQLKSRWTPTGK